MKRHIAVLGTGRMGSALALAFLADGHTVTVWNRTASKATALATRGVRVAASMEDAVATADLVIGNVSDYGTTALLLEPPSVRRALRGKVFVQLATGTARQAKELAAWAQENGVMHLDGAIMATPDFIGKPNCTLLYSGEHALFEAHASTLRTLGGNTHYVGNAIGHANALDAAVLTVLWGSLFGTWHAAAICEAERLPLEVLGSTLAATMPVIDASLKDAVERIARQRFTADETTFASVATCYASVRLIDEISREHGIDVALPEALTTVFERSRQAGRADDDVASVYQAVKNGGRP